MPVKHQYQSGRGDNGDPGAIQPSHFNADHLLTGLLALIDQVAPAPNTVFTLDGSNLPVMVALGALMRARLGDADAVTFLNNLGAAGLASPAFTGTPTAPTPVATDNTTKLATTAYVKTAIANLVAGAPGVLDTLAEIDAALNNDPNFAATMTTALALKAPLASPALTGAPTSPTPAPGDNTTKIATTAFIVAALAAYAPLASPALTGTPTAPTAAFGNSGGQIATTGFVQAALAPAGQGRLSLSGGNLVLKPFNGNRMTVNGVVCTIPDAGVTLTSAPAYNTMYYIYATQSGGVINALEASATGHSTDTTAGNNGVEIKTGDPTRSLVGMVYTTAGGGYFGDSATFRCVRSWFNRRRLNLRNAFTATRTTTATAFTEINAEIRCGFVLWADEIAAFTINGFSFASVADYVLTAVGIDGAIIGTGSANFGTNGAAIGETIFTNPTEGYHYATLMGRVKTGTTTGSWAFDATTGLTAELQGVIG
ncbi:hypothetical protein [Bradyrhizobium sp. USDA 4350]